MYGALESVAVLWRLRSYRDIIIIINSKQTANRESCLGSRKKDKAKRLLLFRSRTRTDGHKLVYDKCHFCTFCGTKIVSKISSHLVTVHKDKEAIKSISDLPPKGSRQRNLLLQTLVNEDNFKDNTSVTRRGEGEVWADEVQ